MSLSPLPTAVLVGRPNVGKSTIYNALTSSRDAIVSDFEGLTHDRQLGRCVLGEIPFQIVDCGGIIENIASELERGVQNQIQVGIAESSIVLFVIDCSSTLTTIDFNIYQRLRKYDKPILLLANKIDGQSQDQIIADIADLGFDNPNYISALKKRGLKQLLERICATLQPYTSPITEDNSVEATFTEKVAVSIIGRPNVGKSTLINTMVKHERVVVSETPGTTRDTIDVHYKNFIISDTAGIRRKSSKKDAVEIYSIIKAIEAIDKSQIVVIVLDATLSYVTQDLRLMQMVLTKGCALIVALNKIDCISKQALQTQLKELGYKLDFAEYLHVAPISAKHNKGIRKLFQIVQSARYNVNKPLATNKLTTILQSAILENPPPFKGRHQIKMRYAHRGSDKKRTIIIHGTNVDKVPLNYQKYLQRYFRKYLQLQHTPLQLEFKVAHNPYEKRKNVLTHRQKQKRYRMLKFHNSK